MRRSNVVLPHPLGPRITTASPAGTSSDTSSSAGWDPSRFDTCRDGDRRSAHDASRWARRAASTASGPRTTLACSSARIATDEAGALAMIV